MAYKAGALLGSLCYHLYGWYPHRPGDFGYGLRDGFWRAWARANYGGNQGVMSWFRLRE